MDAISAALVLAGIVVSAETDHWWPAVASLGVMALLYGVFLAVLLRHRRTVAHRVDTT